VEIHYIKRIAFCGVIFDMPQHLVPQKKEEKKYGKFG